MVGGAFLPKMILANDTLAPTGQEIYDTVPNNILNHRRLLKHKSLSKKHPSFVVWEADTLSIALLIHLRLRFR
jgi:hypothetical protein